MAVETRVIIDANAQNAIREIGKLDEAAGEADDTLKKLDGQTVDVDTTESVDGMDELRRMGEEAIASVKALSQQRVDVAVDTSGLATAAGDVDALQADAKAGVHMEIDVDADKLDRVKKSADDVESSGRAASTAIGGIGNTVSELPGIGALGGMAESMGQLTEGALEGEVALGQLAATAGGLALVALAAKGIQGHFEKIAETKAFRADQVEKWADALREGESLLEALNDELAKTGQLQFQGWDGVADLVPILADAGKTTADWTAAVEGNAAAQRAFLEDMSKSGISHGELLDVVVALKTETENYTAAQERAADAAAVGRQETDDGTVAYHAARDAVRDLAGGLDAATIATKQLEDANAKLRGDLDKREAYLNLLTQFDELKAKGEEAWNATATGAADAEQKARDYELAQIDTKNAVLDYTEQVGKVPTDVTTKLVADVDAGQVDSLKADVDELTNGTKYVDIRVRATIDQAFQRVLDSTRFVGTRP
jgi:hypothetical protein